LGAHQKTYIRNKFEISTKGKNYFLLLKNGINSLKKHLDAKHTVIAKMFEKEIIFY
jgi:hypothetical protein